MIYLGISIGIIWNFNIFYISLQKEKNKKYEIRSKNTIISLIFNELCCIYYYEK